MIHFTERYHFLKSNWLIIILGAAFAVFLASSGRPYIDDPARLIGGYEYEWINNARPLSMWLFRLLAFNMNLVDIFPIGQVIYGILLTISALLIIHHYHFQYKWAALLAVTAPPGFQNLSYHFDVHMFGFSVFFAVLAGLLTLNQTTQRWQAVSHLSLSIILIFCALASYQASLNVYLLFIIFQLSLWSLDTNAHQEDILASLLKTITVCIISIALYKLIVSPPSDSYSLAHSQIASLSTMPKVFLHNLHRARRLLIHCFHGTIFWPWKAVLLLGIVAWLYLLFNSYCGRCAKALLYLLTTVTIVSFPLVLIGPLALLQSPVQEPRTLLSVGFLALFAFMLTTYAWEQFFKKEVFATGLTLCLVLTVVASAEYRNAQSAQESYDAVLAQKLANDLEELFQKYPNTHFDISYHPSRAPRVKLLAKYNGMVRTSVYSDFSNDWPGFGNLAINTAIPLKEKATKNLNNDEYLPGFKAVNPANFRSSNLIKETSLYKIYKVDDLLIVDLKNEF